VHRSLNRWPPSLITFLETYVNRCDDNACQVSAMELNELLNRVTLCSRRFSEVVSCSFNLTLVIMNLSTLLHTLSGLHKHFLPWSGRSAKVGLLCHTSILIIRVELLYHTPILINCVSFRLGLIGLIGLDLLLIDHYTIPC